MPDTFSSAERLLAGLSPIQQEAVRWNDGAMLLLAGPGSGKTQVLTLRIARLLEASADQKYKILGLTFTNKAADEMRARVENLVPDHASRLFLGTFHSFCAEVLRQHGTHLGIAPDFRIYSTRGDLELILRGALEEVRKQGGDVGDADVSLLPVIERLRAELVEPTDAPLHVASESLKERITAIYTAYDVCQKRTNALDFGSLLFYAVKLFREFPAFARRYRKVYAYWCIDEFQDTNTSQYALLRAMAGDEFKNVFAVADDDQIIYEWNGASHRRLDDFKRDFEPEVLQLPTNYRCLPQIVSLANSLIRHNTRRMPGKKPFESGKPAGLPEQGIVRLGRYASDREETQAVAQDIRRLHAGALHKVAVLARNRRLLELAQRALTEVQVPSVIRQRRDSFESAPFVWLNACLRQSNHRRDAQNLELLCATFRELAGVELDPNDVIAAAETTHQDYFRQWADLATRADFPPSAQEAARQVTEQLVRRTDYTSFIAFATGWFDTLMQADGAGSTEERFAGYANDKRAWALLNKEISQTLGTGAPLEAFLHELDLRSKEPPPQANTVSLMTIHGAKGKEFDHIYLMGLAEDQLPSFQARKRGDQSVEMEEERRNCFVAVTRARETLTLTYAQTYSGYAKEPSRFLTEMGFQIPSPG
jgi:DNA helicase-2/ATP-dependent DNA helicase PcrA